MSAIWSRVLPEPRKGGGVWPATSWISVEAGLGESEAKAKVEARSAASDLHKLAMEYQVLPNGVSPTT